jgi:enoyl-CoA hydratase/carnithine racemase
LALPVAAVVAGCPVAVRRSLAAQVARVSILVQAEQTQAAQALRWGTTDQVAADRRLLLVQALQAAQASTDQVVVGRARLPLRRARVARVVLALLFSFLNSDL